MATGKCEKLLVAGFIAAGLVSLLGDLFPTSNRRIIGMEAHTKWTIGIDENKDGKVDNVYDIIGNGGRQPPLILNKRSPTERDQKLY